MKKFGFLTSMVFATMIAPAFADIANDTESATCNSDTIGVSDGSTVLEAQWTAQSITCPSGTYLEADNATCTACPAGSYCAGDTYTFNGTDLGITGACESGYTTDGSAAAQSDCYRACTTDDIAHSTAVSGKYYYGDNNQCEATECAAGYTPKAGLDMSTYASQNPTTSAYGFIRHNGSYLTGGTTHDQEYYGISGADTWGNDLGFGIIHGQARCSVTQGDNNGYQWSNPTMLSNIKETTGEYCYCNVTGFKASGSDSFVALSSPWVYCNDHHPAFNCATYCADYCARFFDKSGWRSALFGSVAPVPASCSANTIGITWKPQNGEANTVNQCTYDGAVTIPETPSRVGYDFNGWKVEIGE